MIGIQLQGKLRACGIAAIAALAVLFAGCQGLPSTPSPPPPKPNPGIDKSINHIIFMAQENRSFDNYFGQLPAYWAANGYPAQQFDGLPMNPPPSNPTFDGNSTISAYHLGTTCIENLSPSWNESHLDWNLHDPLSGTALMNGFVWNAAGFARNENKRGATPAYTDTEGKRAIGYYDGNDLNYYYFMASNFATSDRWFAPVLDRTPVSRLYLLAATSQGYAYPKGTNAMDAQPLTAPTIFDALTKKGVSWKLYYTDDGCPGPCTYLNDFAPYAKSFPSNVVPISQYRTDVKAGTLPSVAFIEPSYLSGRDEHPSSGTNMQSGAAYAASLINDLMTSPSWKDSVFILTFDEPGGLYDHVQPQPSINPDGISPVDLFPTDICTKGASGAADCNFNTTGFRVPLLVISPFTKKNYVSHTVADFTAILKLIEKRFKVPSLTKRDAAQMDMTEFFDFANVPWATPPSPPAQNTGGTCDASKLE